jgi:DNA-binding CsgD family transcriptional regulator
MRSAADRAPEIVSALTDKQREVLALLGEGRTGKEIANTLCISESAVIQRIETVRSKFDGATRQELGRIWREHGEPVANGACKELTGKSFELLSEQNEYQSRGQDDAARAVEFADSALFNAKAPWQDRLEPRIVPEVLDGENATIFRWVYAVAAAVGLVILMLILLAVADALGNMV